MHRCVTFFSSHLIFCLFSSFFPALLRSLFCGDLQVFSSCSLPACYFFLSPVENKSKQNYDILDSTAVTYIQHRSHSLAWNNDSKKVELAEFCTQGYSEAFRGHVIECKYFPDLSFLNVLWFSYSIPNLHYVGYVVVWYYIVIFGIFNVTLIAQEPCQELFHSWQACVVDSSGLFSFYSALKKDIRRCGLVIWSPNLMNNRGQLKLFSTLFFSFSSYCHLLLWECL